MGKAHPIIRIFPRYKHARSYTFASGRKKASSVFMGIALLHYKKFPLLCSKRRANFAADSLINQ